MIYIQMQKFYLNSLIIEYKFIIKLFLFWHFPITNQQNILKVQIMCNKVFYLNDNKTLI